MKFKKSLLVLAMAGLSTVAMSANAAAAASSSSSTDQQTVQQLQQQVDQLEKQVSELNQQYSSAQQDHQPYHKAASTSTSTTSSNERSKTAANQSSKPDNADNPYSQQEISEFYKNIGGSLVTTSSYLGDHSAFDGSDLIVNYSSVKTDVDLLEQRQEIENALAAKGVTLPDHPRLNLSGEIEGQTWVQNDFSGDWNGNVDLTDAELDMVIEANTWITGYMDLVYDSTSNTNNNFTTLGSNVILDRGFITLGNLNKTPLFGTVGQFYAPFGIYNSYLVSDPMTELLGEANVRAVEVGYHSKTKNGLQAELYLYEPNMTGADLSDAWGGNMDWVSGSGPWSNDFGVGVIANLADAIGPQTAPGGFAATMGNQALAHNVPAVDVNELFQYNQYQFIGEYVGALERFAATDMSYNGHGAQPQALHLEGVYTYHAWSKPGTFALGYGHTWQAVALGLPENRLDATIAYSFFKDTIASLEYRHDFNYSGSDVGVIGNTTGLVVTPVGKSSDTVTAQFDLYF